MNPPLYLATLRLAVIGAVAWAVSVALYAILVVFIYPTMQGITGYEEILLSMPEEVRAAVGLGDPETLTLLFAGGTYDYRAYLSTEYLTWFPILLAVYAIMYAGGLVSREVERGTLDLVLSQPLRRTTFLLTKFSGFATLVVAVVAASFASLAIGSSFLDAEVSLGRLALVHLVGALLVLAIAAYSTLASCLLLDPRKSLAVAGVVTLLSYLLLILAPSLKALPWVEDLSLFHYYVPVSILLKGEVNGAGLLVYVGTIVVALAVALAVFQRKDILK